jgi:hypothetical protein
MNPVTYFADLSPYCYAVNGRHDDLVEHPDAVNIGGWAPVTSSLRARPRDGSSRAS